MINQVTIIIVTEVKTVHYCIAVSLGLWANLITNSTILSTVQCEDGSFSIHKRAKLPKIIKT